MSWVWLTNWAVSTMWRVRVNAEEIIDYTRRDNVAERLVKWFGAALGAAVVQATQSSAVLR